MKKVKTLPPPPKPVQFESDSLESTVGVDMIDEAAAMAEGNVKAEVIKEAEEQLQKGKLALQKHFEKAVKGEIKTRKVIEIFKNLPAFVAMPNCPRPSEVCALKANALYKEDCSSLEAFDKWWNDNVVTAKHPAVDQKIYEDLVIW